MSTSWNPFELAPFGEKDEQIEMTIRMDDLSFGQFFDELPRNVPRIGSLSSMSNVKSRESLVMAIDEMDPFGAAPFDPAQKRTPHKDTPQKRCTTRKENYLKMLANREILYETDSVGSASDLRQRMQMISTTEDESEGEQKKVHKQRFTYQHFEGVGDDDSSDSKCVDDDDFDEDSTEDINKNGLPTDESGNLPLLLENYDLDTVKTHLTGCVSNDLLDKKDDDNTIPNAKKDDKFASVPVLIESRIVNDSVIIPKFVSKPCCIVNPPTKLLPKPSLSSPVQDIIVSAHDSSKIAIQSVKMPLKIRWHTFWKYTFSNSSGSSSLETDDSGAEICRTKGICKTEIGPARRRSTSELLHRYHGGIWACSSDKCPTPCKSTARVGSALDEASFVNVSFQSEDPDSYPVFPPSTSMDSEQQL